MGSIFRSKKGNAVLDTAVLLGIAFLFILFAIVSKVVLSDLNADIQADDSMDSQAKEVVSSQNDSFGALFDNGFLMVFVFAWILMLVAGFMSDTHPVFFVVTLIFLIFVFIVASIIGNVYEEIIADESFATAALSFPKSHWVMTHTLQTAIVVGFSLAIVLFAKKGVTG